MIREPRILRDGLLSTLGGLDSGRSPSLIGRDQLSFGVNVALRGGFPATRPRLDQKTFFFPNSEIEDWFEDHVLQGLEFYYALNGQARIITSVGGRIFALTPMQVDGAEQFEVSEITPTIATETTADFTVPAVGATVVIAVVASTKMFAGYPLNINGAVYIITSVSGLNITVENVTDTAGNLVTFPATVVVLDPNAPERELVWMEQGDKYFFIQDGQGGAIIYDGATARRADPANLEVPTGTAMVFNEEIGRLAVAVSDNQLAIGDVLGGPSPIYRFEEETFLAEGGRFKLPLKFGRIVGMKMIDNLDRANGQGPMIVFAERGFTAFVLPANRTAWKNLTYPVQINMPYKYSATSQGSITNVNGDLFYRSPDGLRSFLYARRDFSQPGNVPISREISRILDDDDRPLLRHASSMLFDNRLILTVSPAPSSNGVYHRGLAPLDFDLVSRMGLKAPPTYDGMWTGVKATKLIAGSFDGQERGFIFAINNDTLKNELWELHRETGFDTVGDTEVRIQSAIESRALDGQRPVELKRLDAVEVWLDQVIGEVTLVAQYKPDDYQCWFTIGEKELCQTYQDCTDDEECKPLQTYNPGYRTRIAFGQPPDVAEAVDAKPARLGYHFQVRLAWKGQCRVRKVLVKLGVVEESVWNTDKEQ